MKRFDPLLVLSVCCILTLPDWFSAIGQPFEYDVVRIEYQGPGLPPFNVIPRAVNNAGVVVGAAQFSSPLFQTRAFVWHATTGMELIPLLPGENHAEAYGINDFGVIAGGSPSGQGVGWIYENGQISSIGIPPGYQASVATGVNSSGQVCGIATHPSITVPDAAFVFEPGVGFTLFSTSDSDARAINDSGQVAGSTLLQAFRYDPISGLESLGSLSPTLAATFSRDMNESGQIVGFGSNTGGTSSRRAFLNSPGVGMIQIPSPGGNAIAYGVNNLGEVVGDAETPSEAWTWSLPLGLRTLSNRIDPALGLPLLAAFDINDMGQIAASSTSIFTPQGTVARPVLLTPHAIGAAPGPTNLVCDDGVDSVTLTWTNSQPYQSLEVFRDGVLLNFILGTETIYVDGFVPLGPHTYRVRGQTAAGNSDPAFCASLVDGLLPAPNGLVCTQVAASVQLSWSASPSYDVTRVYRDTTLLAQLSSAELSYVDSAVPNGLHEYEIIGETGGISSAPSRCAVTVSSPGAVVLYSALGTAATQAHSAELVAASIPFVETNNLTSAPLSPDTTLIAVYGMFPNNAPLTMADGQILADHVTSGGSLYIEGGDVWGTSIMTAFQAISGIDDNYSGGNFATPSLQGMDANPEIGLAQVGTVPYSGSSASMDWIYSLSPFARPIWNRPVNGVFVGMINNDPSQGTIIASTFEFSGLPVSVRPVVFAEYLQALGVPSTGSPSFVRGDANADTAVNLADPVTVLQYLFQAGPASACADAMDVNDDGTISIADPVYQLANLFSGGAAPPPPYPSCGPDPTSDSTSCVAPSCP